MKDQGHYDEPIVSWVRPKIYEITKKVVKLKKLPWLEWTFLHR